MVAPDARTRRKISLQPAKVLTGSLSRVSLHKILTSNVLFVLALYAAKESLLSYDVGVFWVVMRVLACGGLGMLIWEGLTSALSKKGEIEWTALGVSSLLLFVQQAALYTALYRLPSPRVILFAHFSVSWVDAVVAPASIRKSLAVALSFFLSFLFDVTISRRSAMLVLPGHGSLLLHGLTTFALERLRGVLSPTVGPAMMTAASTLGAALLGLPLYGCRQAFFNLPPSPVLPLLSLTVLPLLAYIMVFLTPDTTALQYNASQTSQTFLFSYPFAFLVAIALGHLGFSQYPHWTDLLVGVLLYYGLCPGDGQSLSATPRAPVSKLLRFYLNSILSDSESRKIFYFLVLNMCYMLVQMLYGVWTNSLGLISDAIHMAFDCMAIGVGLLASIMAKWPPNERFTYGFGRIETLSGFANGIFLVLISVFIVFEAVQRILDPPDMITSQLLLISSLGLGVNLFGMFAMGGHHHGHGHSHHHDCLHIGKSRSHSHEHEHNHDHDCSHSRYHTHEQGHKHHSHSHPHEVHTHPEKYDRPDGDNHLHRCDHGVTTHHHSEDSSKQKHTDRHPDELHVHSRSPPVSTGSEQHVELPKSSTIRGRKPHSRGPSLQTAPEGVQTSSSPSIQVPFPIFSPPSEDSPISPSYPSTLKHDHHHLHHHELHSAESCSSHSQHDHEGHSHNMRGVFLHVMADTLGSVGVIISTLLIQYYGWTGFDPIASLFIAVLIVASVVPLVIDTGRVLSLDLDDENGVEQALFELSRIEGVASYSSPRFWPKDSSSIIGSIHIQLSPSYTLPPSLDTLSGHSHSKIDRVLERVDTLLRSRIPGLEEITIQIEESSHSRDSSN
ncbi:cation efflux protein [Phlebopus sp. FC_14]|nr:cation efflux protein [Phlebopus sp. FC_14]